MPAEKQAVINRERGLIFVPYGAGTGRWRTVDQYLSLYETSDSEILSIQIKMEGDIIPPSRNIAETSENEPLPLVAVLDATVAISSARAPQYKKLPDSLFEGYSKARAFCRQHSIEIPARKCAHYQQRIAIRQGRWVY